MGINRKIHIRILSLCHSVNNITDERENVLVKTVENWYDSRYVHVIFTNYPSYILAVMEPWMYQVALRVQPVIVFMIIIIIIISTTMFMVLSSWQSHCESSPGSFDECRMAPSGRRPKTKPNDLGCESACTGCQKLHPPSPFIITQPESWYSFYRPTEGRRLSRPSWLVTYRDGLPVHRRSPIRVLTGSDLAQLRWSKPTCYH